MKTLLIVAGTFFLICGGLVAYFANSGPGHEYDLKLVLPIDTRQMPTSVLPPPVPPTVESEEPTEPPITQNRAEAGTDIDIKAEKPFQFEDRQGLPSQPRAHQ